jgi:hypothetical protein
MNDWQSDPEVMRAAAERRARMSLIRTSVFWVPIFLVTAGALLFFAFEQATGGERGSWFLVGVLVLLSTLFGFQGLQSFFDLFTKPRVATEMVTRKWSRTDSLVIRSHYVRMGRKLIFRMHKDLHGDFKPGDWVTVRYYPHSATVIEAWKADTGEDEAEETPASYEDLKRRR